MTRRRAVAMLRRPCSTDCRNLMLASSAPESPDAIEQLIDGCLRGDQQAWDLIVTRYWRKVFNVAYKFVGRHDLADQRQPEPLYRSLPQRSQRT